MVSPARRIWQLSSAVGELLMQVADQLVGEFKLDRNANDQEGAIAVADRAIGLLSDWAEYDYFDHQHRVLAWVVRKSCVVADREGVDHRAILKEWAMDDTPAGVAADYLQASSGTSEGPQRTAALQSFVKRHASGYWTGMALLDMAFAKVQAGDLGGARSLYRRALPHLSPGEQKLYALIVEDPTQIRQMMEYEREYQRRKTQTKPLPSD